MPRKRPTDGATFSEWSESVPMPFPENETPLSARVPLTHPTKGVEPIEYVKRKLDGRREPRPIEFKKGE